MGTSSWVEVEAAVKLELEELDGKQRLGFLRVPMESKSEKKKSLVPICYIRLNTENYYLKNTLG